LAFPSVTEKGVDAVEELLLPLADLDRVDLERLRELGDGLVLLGGLQRDLGLERGRVSLSFARHDAPRDGSVSSDQFNISSGPVLGVHLTCRERGGGVAR